jgi:small ligand-binding sensory domain FIST
VERTRLACRIGAGLSTAADAVAAAREAAEAASDGSGGSVDLCFAFLSEVHADAVEDACGAISEVLAPSSLVGCVAEGIAAQGRELEEGPGVAVWAASLPGARIEAFHTVALDVGDGIAIAGFPDVESAALVAILVDPYTFPAGPFLARLNEERPGLPLVGGLVAAEGEKRTLVVDREAYDQGAVGAVVSGVPVETVVSQGCAPIGRDAVITHAEENLVYELAGEPALERLRAELTSLGAELRRLASGGILAGLVIDENRSEYGRGDYLMRAILGADDETGALAIGERVRVGQTLRFHIRDAASADRDLREALAGLPGGAAGALLFTCNGRGTRMFEEPDHDARAIAEALGGAPVAGFFCGGEIGPVGPRSFLHGFTATLAVFLAGGE